MAWFLALVIFLAAVALVIWFLHAFYAKANRDTALVRTGLGGQKVVIDGGCLALPIVHHIQKVSMRVMALELAREGRDSLLTGDRLRADVQMEFEFRVTPTKDCIAAAAQSLGHGVTRGGEALTALLRGSFVNAMQDAAAARTLAEMHENRSGYTREVSEAAGPHLEKFGLSLISAALVKVDQGNPGSGADSNAFDSEGARRLAEIIAENRQARERIETSAEIAVRESQLERTEKRLASERAEREAEIAQREELARLQAEAEATSAAARAEATYRSEVAGLEKERNLAVARIAHDRELREQEMTAIQELEETKIEHAKLLAARRAEEAETRAAEERAQAAVALAMESVQTDREAAAAEREKKLAVMKAEKDSEVRRRQAQAEAVSLRIRSEAEANAVETAANAEGERAAAEARGREAQIRAENSQSDAVIAQRLEERRLDRLPDIMSQMMKPVEKIDSIRINQLSAPGSAPADGPGVDNAFGAAMDQILGMAVRLPAMKQMGEEIGLDFDSALAGRTADYANRISRRADDRDRLRVPGEDRDQNQGEKDDESEQT